MQFIRRGAEVLGQPFSARLIQSVRDFHMREVAVTNERVYPAALSSLSSEKEKSYQKSWKCVPRISYFVALRKDPRWLLCKTEQIFR